MWAFSDLMRTFGTHKVKNSKFYPHKPQAHKHTHKQSVFFLRALSLLSDIINDNSKEDPTSRYCAGTVLSRQAK